MPSYRGSCTILVVQSVCHVWLKTTRHIMPAMDKGVLSLGRSEDRPPHRHPGRLVKVGAQGGGDPHTIQRSTFDTSRI
jgi:hypothetical protein